MDAIKGKRDVDFVESDIHQATVYDGDSLEPGMSFTGPAIIEEADTTVVIPPDLPCFMDDFGNYCIQTAK